MVFRCSLPYKNLLSAFLLVLTIPDVTSSSNAHALPRMTRISLVQVALTDAEEKSCKRGLRA